MGVNLIFRIAAVGILVSVICQVLRHSGREEQAFLTSLAGLVLVLFWLVPYIHEFIRGRRNSWCSGEMLRYHEELRLRRQLTGLQLTLMLESVGIKQD